MFLLAAGTAWNGGDVGPAVEQLTSEFSVSLSSVGFLSGTVLFAALVAASLATPKLSEAIGAGPGAKLSAVLCGAGNVVCAVGPSYGSLFAGRIVAGAGLGISLVLGPAVARAAGGVRLLGVFGAGIMLGVAAALGIGRCARGRRRGLAGRVRGVRGRGLLVGAVAPRAGRGGTRRRSPAGGPAPAPSQPPRVGVCSCSSSRSSRCPS
jgi:MFS family permease